jgi:hypothetical protein
LETIAEQFDQLLIHTEEESFFQGFATSLISGWGEHLYLQGLEIGYTLNFGRIVRLGLTKKN